MVFKEVESELHLMSNALNIVVNFLGIGPGIVVGERVTGIGGMIRATVNFWRSVARFVRFEDLIQRTFVVMGDG
jgi:hypothetical protein